MAKINVGVGSKPTTPRPPPPSLRGKVIDRSKDLEIIAAAEAEHGSDPVEGVKEKKLWETGLSANTELRDYQKYEEYEKGWVDGVNMEIFSPKSHTIPYNTGFSDGQDAYNDAMKDVFWHGMPEKKRLKFFVECLEKDVKKWKQVALCGFAYILVILTIYVWQHFADKG